MYISNNKFRLGAVTRANVHECAKLLAEQFVLSNDAWSTVNPPMEDAYKFMVNKTQEVLDWEDELKEEGMIPQDAFLSFTYLNEHGEIIGVTTNCELTQYLNKKSRVKLPQFEVLEKYGHELEKNIYAKDIVPGKNLYGIFTTMKKEYLGTGIVMLFWFDFSHYLHSLGFRFIYCRASSPKSQTNLARYGADDMAYIEGIEDGKKMRFWWMRWGLRPISVIGHLVDKFKIRAKM